MRRRAANWKLIHVSGFNLKGSIASAAVERKGHGVYRHAPPHRLISPALPWIEEQEIKTAQMTVTKDTNSTGQLKPLPAERRSATNQIRAGLGHRTSPMLSALLLSAPTCRQHWMGLELALGWLQRM
jgi:hypothetical protein